MGKTPPPEKEGNLLNESMPWGIRRENTAGAIFVLRNFPT
jgi:hypothetical protein